jgi:superfamily II DNA helicase RecQ
MKDVPDRAAPPHEPRLPPEEGSKHGRCSSTCPPGRQQQDGQSGGGRGSTRVPCSRSTQIYMATRHRLASGGAASILSAHENHKAPRLSISRQPRCDLCRFRRSIWPNQDPPAYLSCKCDALIEVCKSTGRERIEVHQRKHHNRPCFTTTGTARREQPPNTGWGPPQDL